MENVTPSRAAAATACEIQLRAVSPLYMSHSRLPAAGCAVAKHSRKRCMKPGSGNGTAAGSRVSPPRFPAPPAVAPSSGGRAGGCDCVRLPQAGAA